jgi:farnesyl-diphosphate farnesyltransferase
MNVQQELQQAGVDPSTLKCADFWKYSSFMLMKVSRTFALNINVLTGKPRKSMLLAYLFCRMADTVEDDPELSAWEKQELLTLFAAIFDSNDSWQDRAQIFCDALPPSWGQSEDWNHILCRFAHWPLELHFESEEPVLVAVKVCVQEMCAGMSEFAVKQEQTKGWFSLQSVAELDEYCYYVAGIVGLMISDLFGHFSPLIFSKRFAQLRSRAVAFGLALQITNILKDVKEDELRGVCFLPEELAQKYQLTSRELFFKENHQAGSMVVATLCQKAWKHLEDALEYTLLLPRLEPRMRLFCLWPLFMAAENLAAIGTGENSFAEEKIKISRLQVKSIIGKTTLRVASNFLLRKWFYALQKPKLQELQTFLHNGTGGL